MARASWLTLIWLSVGLVVVAGCDSAGSKPPASVEAEDAATDAGEPDADVDRDRDAADGGSQTSGSRARCGELKCAAPATCSEKGGETWCRCPSGYDDVNGDGSECKDEDECARVADNDCDAKASCKNTPGGYECKCKAGYAGDGKTCACADGYLELEGECLAQDGNRCEDDLDCEKGNCVSGICCAVACGSPTQICHTAQHATCEDGKTCKYPVSPDGEACDDGDACLSGSTCQGETCQAGTLPINCDDGNPCTDDSCDPALGCRNQNNPSTCDDANACTQDDRCSNGVCAGSAAVDCSSRDDACNKGTCNPADGSCGKQPTADGASCDDANSCTTLDQCSAGACGGQGNACGVNASACSPGTPNVCTCNDQYLAADGLCVPLNNECDANPCSLDASCFDPSNLAGDVTCKCKVGYAGDGITCTATNPCADNPCGEGRGTCTNGTAGKYTCSCSAGFIEVAGSCVCDLNGTFVVRLENRLEWSGQTGVENGSAMTPAWTIERHAYDADGNLETESILCGELETELCGQGNPLVPPEAYAQYIPIKVYGSASMPVGRQRFSVLKPVPNEPYETPLAAQLTGLSLADPLGEFPIDRHRIAGSPDASGEPLNGARWIDADGDSSIGITTYAVGPGGIAAGSSEIAPIATYGATSQVCPRSKPDAERLPYNYPPATEGLQVRRVKRIYSANRTITKYAGKIDSCDSISGEVLGPAADGHQRIDAVIGGCVRVEGANGEAGCSSQLTDFFSSDQGGQDLPPGKFVMRRAPDTLTCEQARAFAF